MIKNPFYEIDNIEYDEYILPNYITEHTNEGWTFNKS